MDSNSEPQYAANTNEKGTLRRPERHAERAYFMEALRFLADACDNWRALAVHWADAGDHERADDAMAHVQKCELQRRRLLAAMGELEP